jgi:hypothetical protein
MLGKDGAAQEKTRSNSVFFDDIKKLVLHQAEIVTARHGQIKSLLAKKTAARLTAPLPSRLNSC